MNTDDMKAKLLARSYVETTPPEHQSPLFQKGPRIVILGEFPGEGKVFCSMHYRRYMVEKYYTPTTNTFEQDLRVFDETEPYVPSYRRVFTEDAFF